MANLVEYSILNGVDNDLIKSIEAVGGDTSKATGIVDLADVIRTQLISNKAVGEGIYDDWMFGHPDTNDIFETPTESTNAVQAKVIANSIRELYELMKQNHRHVVYVVDQLPETEKSLSAIYLVRHPLEDNTIVKNVDVSEDISIMPNSKGTAQYKNNIITIRPDSDGQVNMVCGWENVNCRTADFNNIIIKTNILSWGNTGVKYSLNGSDFYPIKSDIMNISMEELTKLGIDKISKFLISVDSINTKYNCTEVLIREVYLEKIEKYVSNYSVYYFMKEGGEVVSVNLGDVHIDFNQLFYATRDEFIDETTRIDKYVGALEDTLRKQFGSYLNSGSMTVEETLNMLRDRCDFFDAQLHKYITIDDIVTEEKPGLMTSEDKIKLGEIESISDEHLDQILN